MGNNPSHHDDHQFVWFTLLFFIFMAYIRIEESIRSGNSTRFILAALAGLIASSIIILGIKWRTKNIKNLRDKQNIIEKAKDSVFSGVDEKGRHIHIKPGQRIMHTQIVGTTNAGKTESVILPWAIQDIAQGRGLIIIDGKADSGLLDKLYAYSCKHQRQSDFRLFSLMVPEKSHQFNPLEGGTPEEITERVFTSFEFENPHYRNLQFEVFSQVMRIFDASKLVPTFQRLRNAINNPNSLMPFCDTLSDADLKDWANHFRGLAPSDRETRTSGLLSALSHFSFGKPSSLFNTEQSHFTIESALQQNLIVYFQLPSLLSPFLGKATGKLVLQCFQSAIANRHRGRTDQRQFFSIFLDDFTEYLYPGFVTILNKSRSANVGVVFAHQALGDLKVLGDSVANSILTNSNLKIFMRGNDPESAEYFSKVIGTRTGKKVTERHKLGTIHDQATGDASVRDVEEFIVHPNCFKRDLGVGDAIMLIPHRSGTTPIRIKLSMMPDLPAMILPDIDKRKSNSSLISTLELNTQSPIANFN